MICTVLLQHEGNSMKGVGNENGTICLHFVQEVVQGRDNLFDALAFADIGDNLERLGCDVHGVAGQNLPMVEDALREGLATGVGAEIGGETFRKDEGVKN